jgi:ABC-type transport system involved in cytochrome bd biosynthesis fused ATPase/permease subunit
MILILAPEIYFPIRNAAALFHASTDGNEALAKLREIPNSETEVLKSEAYPVGMKFWIGESGAGKSTAAMELINSFNRSGIGWIPQHPRLAQGSVRMQFQLIKPEITDFEIQELLMKVNLDPIDLPRGLDSTLEAGSELLSTASGGQIRKVAIARALVCLPKLLIADEPTADLDPASANRVMQTLRSLSCGLIIITHDLSLLKPDDEVVRFER